MGDDTVGSISSSFSKTPYNSLSLPIRAAREARRSSSALTLRAFADRVPPRPRGFCAPRADQDGSLGFDPGSWRRRCIGDLGSRTRGAARRAGRWRFGFASVCRLWRRGPRIKNPLPIQPIRGTFSLCCGTSARAATKGGGSARSPWRRTSRRGNELSTSLRSSTRGQCLPGKPTRILALDSSTTPR